MTWQEKTEKHNPNWPQIPDHPYTILVTAGSELGETNALLNLSHQPDIDEIYLFVKGPYKAKHQLLISKP